MRRLLLIILAGILTVHIGGLPAAYRAVSTMPDLIMEVDRKDPGGVQPTEVRTVADQLLDQTGRNGTAALHSRIASLAGVGKASTSLQAIVGAALKGRVAAMLFGPDRGGSDSAVNTAALATLRAGGDVREHAELPPNQPVAALFRY